MTTKTATGTGNFGASGTWSPSGAPGTGDVATIPSGATVTATTGDNAQDVIIQTGGKLRISAGGTFKVSNSITSQVGGSLISLGTNAALAVITNTTAGWYPFICLTSPGSDTNMDYLQVYNNMPCLGSDTNNMIIFNNPAYRYSSWLNNATPLSRAPIILNHDLDGRAYGRTYRRGSKAGTVTVSGIMYYNSFDWNILKVIQANNNSVSLTTNYVHLPNCSIDGEPKYSTQAGKGWFPFSVTLIEDR